MTDNVILIMQHAPTVLATDTCIVRIMSTVNLQHSHALKLRFATTTAVEVILLCPSRIRVEVINLSELRWHDVDATKQLPAQPADKFMKLTLRARYGSRRPTSLRGLYTLQSAPSLAALHVVFVLSHVSYHSLAPYPLVPYRIRRFVCPKTRFSDTSLIADAFSGSLAGSQNCCQRLLTSESRASVS